MENTRFTDNGDGTTPDTLLKSRSKMSGFIHSLSSLGITNCSGSAYRAVRLCYFKDGILLVDYYHVDDSCSIFICSDPNTKIKAGCQSSCANDNAMPRPENGELIVVWQNGRWVKQGPWVEKIIALIADLIGEKERKTEEKIKKEEALRKERSMINREREKELVENWR